MKHGNRFIALAMAMLFALTPVQQTFALGLSYADASYMVSAKKSGWVNSGTRTYYYRNGKKVKGIAKIGGKYYIFNSNSGALLKDKIIYQYNNSKYYKINKAGVATRFKGTSYYAAKLLYTQMRSSTAFNYLKKGFQWAASCDFISNMPEPADGANKASYYGSYGLTNHRGDCAVMAYTFYWMAKVLGYKVKVIDGYYLSGSEYKEHSWCEIVHGGVAYVYDPDFNLEFKNRISRSSYGFNSIGFKVRYGDSQTLKYCRPDKTEIEKGGKA